MDKPIGIFLQNWSSIPMVKECISKDEDEATYKGYDYGHSPEPLVLTYRPRKRNFVAVITNVVFKNGSVVEQFWNGKRGMSPEEEYFAKNGNR